MIFNNNIFSESSYNNNNILGFIYNDTGNSEEAILESDYFSIDDKYFRIISNNQIEVLKSINCTVGFFGQVTYTGTYYNSQAHTNMVASSAARIRIRDANNNEIMSVTPTDINFVTRTLSLNVGDKIFFTVEKISVPTGTNSYEMLCGAYINLQ